MSGIYMGYRQEKKEKDKKRQEKPRHERITTPAACSRGWSVEVKRESLFAGKNKQRVLVRYMSEDRPKSKISTSYS